MANRGTASESLIPAVSSELRGLAPEAIGRNQKLRLEAAMVEAVARYGYSGTTLRELVRLAGVSKSTFYEHFDSKEECFLSTFDEIIAGVAERVSAAYRSGGDLRGRLTAALHCFMSLAINEPKAATLTVVESLALGSAGVVRRERGLEVFEVLIRQSFEHADSSRGVSRTTVRAIAAGIRGVVYRRLRAGRVEELPGTVDQLVDWALGYQRPADEVVERAVAAAAEPAVPAAPEERDGGLDWSEPPDSARSRAELSQRERILRAVAQLVLENGYENLSIPAISGKAGVSNQTFYENFDDKRDAFLTVFDAGVEQAIAITREAFETAGTGPDALGAATRAFLEHIAGDELFAPLTFFNLQTAGPVALDRADAVLDDFMSLLGPQRKRGSTGERGEPGDLSETLVHAIGSGCLSVIQQELRKGNVRGLPDLAPEVVLIMVAPIARSAAHAHKF